MKVLNISSDQSLILYMQSQGIDGSQGEYRAPACDNLLRSNTDWDAIHQWLQNKFKNKSNTLRQYQTQAERLLLWAVIEKNKPISSLNETDFEAYVEFLQNPQPRSRWCFDYNGIKEKQSRGEDVNTERWESDWRPFKGPLSISGIKTAMHAISTMLNYWKDYGYVRANMLKMIDLSHFDKAIDIAKLSVTDRVLSKDEWQAIMRCISDMPEISSEQKLKKKRIHFLLITLLITACRRQEISDMRWSHFRCERDTWRLYVLGKGDKVAKITLPDNYIQLANEYRSLYELPMLKNSDNEDVPVFTRLTSLKPLIGDTVNVLVKDICKQAIQYTDLADAKHALESATVHWLRHTAATVLDDMNVDKELIKQHMRHENSNTTDIYIHKHQEELKNILDKTIENYT